MENNTNNAHQEFFDLIQTFLSEKEMKFVKKHIDTLNWRRSRSRTGLMPTTWT